MPIKYHLANTPAPHRSWIPGALNLLDWEEGCLKCTECVKKRCVYGVYVNREIDPRSLTDTLDALCKNCLSCVQNCPGRLISITAGPEYMRLGDEYWTPEVLSQIYYQAESGQIPVSGAGYGGPFCGPGFDSMWTDMSEIVRPTRDGIHGREYISTAVDLGWKPEFVVFSPAGEEPRLRSRYVESPLPFLLGLPEGRRLNAQVIQGLAAAAAEMNTFFLVPANDLDLMPEQAAGRVIPRLTQDSLEVKAALFRGHKIVEVDYWDGLWQWLEHFRSRNSETVLGVRLPFDPGVPDLLEPLLRAGADIIHLTADDHGRRPGSKPGNNAGPYLKDMIREAHLKLVETGRRDQVTLMVSGGLALAEHVAKAIICGADAVVLDQVLWAALECRLCRDCLSRSTCPVDLESAPPEWIRQRIVNLSAAWRNQLIEVLGAMGLREIRRLRGEVGRAMFFEQLEEESFGPIFGRRQG